MSLRHDRPGSQITQEQEQDTGPVYEDVEETVPTAGQLRLAAFKERLKLLGRFLSSHLGLLTIVVLYAIAGGVIFQQLESTNEKSECIEAEGLYEELEAFFVEALWEVSCSQRKQYQNSALVLYLLRWLPIEMFAWYD